MSAKFGAQKKALRVVAAGSLMLTLLGPSAAHAQQSTTTSATVAEAVAFREEAEAYSIGLQAMIYGQPVVSLLNEMRRTSIPYTDVAPGPGSEVSPVNAFYNYEKLIEPGTPNPRAPNRDTIYFRAWLDLRASPMIVSAPDTKDRYYNLGYTDLYSETNGHTGRRTTGTGAQKALVVGPGWKGDVPAGMTLIRMTTYQALVWGRIFVAGPDDVKAVNDLISQFKVEPLVSGGAAPPLVFPTYASQDNIDFFVTLNRFLRDTPRKPEEAALMALFDVIGVGPAQAFDPAKISDATRRGLERALRDGRSIIRDGRRVDRGGWTSLAEAKLGVYGTDYLKRAAVNYAGLLANFPEEAIYPRATLDQNGRQMTGERRYRIVFDKPVPVDAFWSITAYDAMKFDLVPNIENRYSVGTNTRGLKVRKDGSVVIELAPEPPKTPGVNWLPVPNGPYFVTLRLYQPRPEILDGRYTLPNIEEAPIESPQKRLR